MAYQEVTEALSRGADPSMLCATCPWDRHCILPPTMTKAEIDAKNDEARREDEAKRALDPSGEKFPVGMLLTAVVYAGKDTAATVCPVFALRLRTSDGEALSKQIKREQQDWAEGSAVAS